MTKIVKASDAWKKEGGGHGTGEEEEFFKMGHEQTLSWWWKCKLLRQLVIYEKMNVTLSQRQCSKILLLTKWFMPFLYDFKGSYFCAKDRYWHLKWMFNVKRLWIDWEKGQMERQFSGKPLRKLWTTPEVVHFFLSERNSGNSITICDSCSVSRPFITRSGKYAGWNLES